MKPKSLLGIYSVYDQAVKEFGVAQSLKNDTIALRSYYNFLRKILPVTRKDYDLYCLGYMDTQSGKVYPKKIKISDSIPDFENNPDYKLPDNVNNTVDAVKRFSNKESKNENEA